MVLVFGTGLAYVYQELNDRVNRCIGYAGRGPEGIALYQDQIMPARLCMLNLFMASP